MKLLGLDIGGTKCAAVTALWDGEEITIQERISLPTDHTIPGEEMAARLFSIADELLDVAPDAIGISCGGPLDTARGIVLSPPNLPTWQNVPITDLAKAHFGVSAHLENDANASALAEWRFGAGRGYKNLIFLTFGTGLGAGLILDGRLYRGANGNAGEVGHVRLRKDGPMGYGKCGSFEGFCSGGGIAQLARKLGEAASVEGRTPSYWRGGEVTAHAVAEAARAGDETAREVFRLSAECLGDGLSLLVDILNPEAIVIGSIYARCEDLLADGARRALIREALPNAAEVLRILPAALGDGIGDYAAIAAAIL